MTTLLMKRLPGTSRVFCYCAEPEGRAVHTVFNDADATTLLLRLGVGLIRARQIIAALATTEFHSESFELDQRLVDYLRTVLVEGRLDTLQ